MNIKTKIKVKILRMKLELQWKKERIEILEISNHTKEYSHSEYIHTAICRTDREVKNFESLAHEISTKVGYDTNGYMFCGLNSIIFLEKNKYHISWNTWHTCD